MKMTGHRQCHLEVQDLNSFSLSPKCPNIQVTAWPSSFSVLIKSSLRSNDSKVYQSP